MLCPLLAEELKVELSQFVLLELEIHLQPAESRQLLRPLILLAAPSPPQASRMW